MIELIGKLFESDEYVGINIEESILFYKNDKKDFWLVIQENDLESLIENQIDLLEECKEANNAPELEKNISMLILWNKGEESFNSMKKKILPIEEDPYYFKKHILNFSSTELEKFKDEIVDNNLREFVDEQVVNYETFKRFKGNPQAPTWESLLYRLAIKLPFIKIDIEENGDLGSLLRQNNQKIQSHLDRTLLDLDSRIFELYEDSVIEDLDINEILENLSPLLVVEGEDEH